MKILLGWFILNSLQAKLKAGKFQFTILWKSLRPKYCLRIGLINATESDHVVTRNSY